MSQAKRDTLARVQAAEEAGQDIGVREELNTLAETAELEHVAPEVSEKNLYCCAKRALSMQRDFQEEKPLLQHIIEDRGHRCLFLPKFHCELNAIELYWGFAKYRKSYFYKVEIIFLHLLKISVSRVMESFPLHRSSSLNVWTCAEWKPFVDILENVGGTWTLIGLFIPFFLFQ